jgi:hypothetical protein
MLRADNLVPTDISQGYRRLTAPARACSSPRPHWHHCGQLIALPAAAR